MELKDIYPIEAWLKNDADGRVCLRDDFVNETITRESSFRCQYELSTADPKEMYIRIKVNYKPI